MTRYACDRCGEVFNGSKIKVLGLKFLCIPCFNRSLLITCNNCDTQLTDETNKAGYCKECIKTVKI